MIQVSFHAAHIGVQPWQGDDGTQGRAIVITDNGVVVTVPLDEAACSEIAAALIGGLVIARNGVVPDEIMRGDPR